jgi:NAD(P)-dependent dehydrogenase (short-subunit alcohol dehydrogenase family)
MIPYTNLGLGAMMARALDANGASKVYIIGRREDALNKTAASAKNGNVVPLGGDISSKSSLQSCVDKVSSEVSHIDVLIANSGVGGPATSIRADDGGALPFESLHSNLWSVEMDDVTASYHVNITGVFYSAVAFLPLLHASNTLREARNPTNAPQPQIIATSSIGGFSRKPMENFCYGPSKAAVTHLMKQMSTILVPYNIRCNVIAPGLYLSELTQDLYEKRGIVKTHNVEGTFSKSEVPLTRTGDEQDMAGVILFLCSRAGGYINGNVVVTDGGRLAVMPATY